MKPNILGTTWNFSQLWNEAMDTLPQRPLVKRDHIWASELGKPMVDRYLKMHAVPFSNPPNARSMRKFISGHIWEWIISLILTMCGILKSKQLRSEVQLPGLLKVTGKRDFVAGGDIDWDHAEAEIKRIQSLFAITVDEMPPFIMHALTHILPRMKKMFANTSLKEMVVEMKSVSSFVSDKIEKTKQPNNTHDVLQIFHYLLPNKMDEGKLLYVCKDDNIMHEFAVPNSKEIMKIYRNDIKQMTEYYNASAKNPLKSLPPIEDEVIFEDGVYRFSKNWRVEYSNYLEMLYGYQTPKQFQMKWQRTVNNWNRVFKRHAQEGTMVTRMEKGVAKSTMMKLTPANIDIIKEARRAFPDWDKYVLKAKKEGVFQQPQEDEDE